MRFTAERGALVSVLAAGRDVAGQRTTIPIIQHLRIELVGDLLTVAATDLDMAITTTAAVTGHGDGAATLPAQQLFDIVKAMPEGCQIEVQPDQASAGGYVIRAGRSRYRLPSLDAKDWPGMVAPQGGATFAMAEPEWKRLLITPMPFISTDQTRQFLMGDFLHFDGRHLCAVGANSHGLCCMTMPAPEGADAMPETGVIIPRETLQRLAKLASGDLAVTVTDTLISFAWGDTVFTSKLIEGIFPDYRRLIPAGLPIKVEAAADEIKAVTSRIALVSEATTKGKTKAVKVAIGRDAATISACSSEGQEGEEAFPITANDDVTLGFNARYLADAMSACNGDLVHLYIGDPMGPVVVNPSNDPDMTLLVMPMAL